MKAKIKERIEQIEQGIVPKGYKETKVGIIPEDWEVKRLGEVTFSVSIKNKDNISYPVYSISNKVGLIPQNEQFEGVDSNDRGYDISLYKIIGEKTFVYNPARINVGSIGYSSNLKNIIVSSLYTCFKTTDQIFDNFLFGFIKSFKFNKQVLRNVEGGVRDYLFYENFSKIILPLPPLREQEKIASILTQWDSFIEEQEKLIEEKRENKELLLEIILSKNSNWKKVRIEKLIKESKDPGSNGKEAKKLTVKLYGKGVYAKDEKGKGSENTKYFIRRKGQFIYSKLDFLNGAFGIIPEELDGYETTSDLPTFDFSLDLIEPNFFLEVVSRIAFYKRIGGNAIGSRKAVRVSPSEFLKSYFYLPPLEEQQKITYLLSKLNEEILLQQDKLNLLREEKKILMQLLLTGIIRV